jgi:putative membrane protein
LTAIASGLGVDVPKTLDAEHDGLRQKLQTLHGKAFDEQYMNGMVQDHEKVIQLFQQEEHSGHNAELKQFAQKPLPALRSTKKMAPELSHKVSQATAK